MRRHPKLLEELVPKLLTLGEVERVLEQLLRERVSIRDLGAILEALLETAPVNKSTEWPGGGGAAGDGPAAGAAAARQRRAACRCCCSIRRSKRRLSQRVSPEGSQRLLSADCGSGEPRWCGAWPIL